MNPEMVGGDAIQKVIAMPFAMQVAKRSMSTISGVNKFGRSTNVDLNIHTDIWDRANPVNDQDTWVAPTQARIHAIVSDSASDIVGGVGARTLKIYGLVSWSADEVSEEITMNGITPVNTVNSYVIIHRMKVVTKGATDINVGLITATAATDTTITAQVNAGEGQTQMAIYGIPSTKVAYMTGYYVSCIRRAASLAIESTLLVNTTPDTELINFTTKHTLGLATEGNNYVHHSYNPFFKITGPAIIKLQANSSADNTDVSAGFDLIIEDV